MAPLCCTKVCVLTTAPLRGSEIDFTEASCLDLGSCELHCHEGHDRADHPSRNCQFFKLAGDAASVDSTAAGDVSAFGKSQAPTIKDRARLLEAAQAAGNFEESGAKPEKDPIASRAKLIGSLIGDDSSCEDIDVDRPSL